MANAVMNDPDTDQFRKRWIEEFNLQKQFPNRRPDRFWQGADAYQELARKNQLARVLPRDEDESAFTRLISTLMQEIRAYKRCAKDIAAANRCFGDALDALVRATKGLGKVHTGEAVVKPEVDQVLARVTLMIDRERLILERRRERYWEELLVASHDEMKHWQPDFGTAEALANGMKLVHAIPPEEVAKSKELFDKFKYPMKLVRRIDVDSRIQVRLAVVLRNHLPLEITRVSLRTIARLVVLSYICGNLAGPHASRLIIEGTGDSLTVGGMDQKFREAGLK